MACLSACASSVDLGMGAPPAPAPVPVSAAPVRLSPVERDFAMKAAASGLYEVEVSRLAASKSLNPTVRNYAQVMVTQHTKLNGELMALMNARGLSVPHTLPDDKAARLQRLAALPASDAFDNGYIRVVGIEDHQMAITLFKLARTEVMDGELREWVERALPMLESHLSAAQAIAGALAG
jgi:putative membrane protein